MSTAYQEELAHVWEDFERKESDHLPPLLRAIETEQDALRGRIGFLRQFHKLRRVVDRFLKHVLREKRHIMD